MDCQRWSEGKSLVLVHDSVHPAGILSSKFRGRDRACFDIFYLQFFRTRVQTYEKEKKKGSKYITGNFIFLSCII